MERTLALITMPLAAAATGIVMAVGTAAQICWFDQILLSPSDLLRDGLVVFLLFTASLGCGISQAMGMGQSRVRTRSKRKANENGDLHESINASLHFGLGPRATH